MQAFNEIRGDNPVAVVLGLDLVVAVGDGCANEVGRSVGRAARVGFEVI